MIFNTDQGSQFTVDAFATVLREHGIRISMDGKGRWVDNVFVERLWRSLKYEEVYLAAYDSIAQARASIGRYVTFFNSEWRHQSLGRRTPDAVYYENRPTSGWRHNPDDTYPAFQNPGSISCCRPQQVMSKRSSTSYEGGAGMQTRRAIATMLLVFGLMAQQGHSEASAPASGLFKPPYPPLDATVEVSGFGLRIQRPMTLLASSTPESRNTVRILFYGQSIAQQEWTNQIIEDLQRRFPHANIVAKNLAIGGFTSQLLNQTVDNDIANFYPDLVIFHVSGAHDKYEKIIATFRAETAAQVAVLNDHLPADVDPAKPDTGWVRFMNEEFLPFVIEKYRCQPVKVRVAWKQYLIRHGLSAQDLLVDDVHLNEFGNWLMAQLVSRQLQYRPDLPQDDWSDLVRTIRANFHKGRLVMTFEGNRVDAISSGGGAGTARVLIDGKSPSQIPSLYAVTRPNDGDNEDWPWTVGSPYRIEWKTPWQEEDWTITITEGGATAFRFSIEGSRTGPDGGGSSEEDFVSESGRVVINANWWWRSVPEGQTSPIRSGYKLKFRTFLLGTDTYVTPQREDQTLESVTTLAQGLPNGQHTLEIIWDDATQPAIEAIRIYRPPLEVMPVRFPTDGAPVPGDSG